MNPFEMVVIIVAITAIASIFKARYSSRHNRTDAQSEAESLRLRDEVKMLRDRVAVLERIATDKETSLEREIERLRDQR
ncbi:MAG TPA: hypothetical protein VI381_02595 [Allosphingosinicella sp.]